MAKPVRRIVTGHDARGKAIVISDGPSPHARTRPETGITSTNLWITDETPANVSGSADRAERSIGIPPPANGSIFRVVEFPPLGHGIRLSNEEILRSMGLPTTNAGSRSPFMHRTKSVDYAICLEGEIHMVLDDSEIVMRAGDTLVQQGTNHAWENRGSVTARIAFILIDALRPPQWHGADH